MERHPPPFLGMVSCFPRFSIMGMCFILESGKKRGEKPAPKASASCGRSVSQDRPPYTSHLLPTRWGSFRMNKLIQRGTGTCEGHTGVSGSAGREPGPRLLPPLPPPHQSQHSPTTTLCHALGCGLTCVLLIKNSPLRTTQSRLLVPS